MAVAQNEPDWKELGALVVSFLQQSLNEAPRGFTLKEFEQKFPERVDEPHDWYKRYGKRNTLEALECIQDSIRLRFDSRYNTNLISLNMESDNVDPHLVDLITNQRQPSKKKSRNFARPSSRALASFSLNRQHSGQSYSRSYHQPARLNHDQQYKGESFIKRRSPPPPAVPRPPPPSRSSSSWSTAPNDPRQHRLSGISPSMIPPQVRLPAQQSPAKPPSSEESWQTTTAPRPPTLESQSASVSRPASTGLRLNAAPRPVEKEPQKDEDPAMVAKKSYLRQRIVSLLMRKHSEIKIIYLKALYKLEYEEEILPEHYGHKNFTDLLMDPALSDAIQIIFKPPCFSISVRPKTLPTGKENVEQEAASQATTQNGTSSGSISNSNGTMSSSKAKLDAVDPFNVRPMLQSLEPLGQIKEPPLKDFPIDDIIKYKTFRMIFRCPQKLMKLEDWELGFEQENRLRIRIRDFGCRTILEFFKRLSSDIPIKIQLDTDDRWIATVDVERVTDWLMDKLQSGHYRALTSIDARYELVAFPDDTYTYSDIKDIQLPNYQPAHILSVKRANSMWIQLRTPKRIEDQLCIEASMTCYEDFHEKKLMPAPQNFIKPGFPCAVLDKGTERWCRALVLRLEKKGDGVEVNTLLVDYGLERTYAPGQLICLMKAHLKFPVGPIFSRLHGVHEDNTNSIKVQRYAKMILQEYTNPPVTLACKFLGASPAQKNPAHLPHFCADVTLVDTRHGKDCNLADDINIPRDQIYIDDEGDSPKATDETTTIQFQQ